MQSSVVLMQLTTEYGVMMAVACLLPTAMEMFHFDRWNICRPQGLEGVLRLRCSAGLDIESYIGACYIRTQTDVDVPAIDCDKAIMVKMKHNEKLQEVTETYFQCALLYTTTSGRSFLQTWQSKQATIFDTADQAVYQF